MLGTVLSSLNIFNYSFFKIKQIFVLCILATLDGSSLLCTGFLQLRRVGAALQLQCLGFSLWWLLAEHRLWACRPSSCALFSCPRVWNLLGLGIKLVLPALASVFLSTVPPEKSLIIP